MGFGVKCLAMVGYFALVVLLAALVHLSTGSDYVVGLVCGGFGTLGASVWDRLGREA